MLLQEVLYVAQQDMQLAASSAFLQILQDQLIPVQNYTQTFLQTILSSVDSKDSGKNTHLWTEKSWKEASCSLQSFKEFDPLY